jgi:hypothetical protein
MTDAEIQQAFQLVLEIQQTMTRNMQAFQESFQKQLTLNDGMLERHARTEAELTALRELIETYIRGLRNGGAS